MLVCAMVENRNKGETTSERHRKIYYICNKVRINMTLERGEKNLA